MAIPAIVVAADYVHFAVIDPANKITADVNKSNNTVAATGTVGVNLVAKAEGHPDVTLRTLTNIPFSAKAGFSNPFKVSFNVSLVLIDGVLYNIEATITPVALQEITGKTASAFRDLFTTKGWNVADSIDLAQRPGRFKGPRRYGQLVASRWPLRSLPPSDVTVPWPERVLSCVVQCPVGPVELHTTGIPPGVTDAGAGAMPLPA